jgi:hypothetical protein
MRVPFILMLLVSAGAVPASAQTVWPDSDPRIAALAAAVSETRL